MDATGIGRKTVYAARGFIALASLALLGAWITEVTESTLLGLSQQDLFNDATVLMLLGIALFIDATWHSRNV